MPQVSPMRKDVVSVDNQPVSPISTTTSMSVPPVSRRQFIQRLGASAGAIALLAACGGPTAATPTTAPAAGAAGAAATTAPTAAAAANATTVPLAITAAPAVTAAIAPTPAATTAPAAGTAPTVAPTKGTSAAATGNTLIVGRGGDSVKLDPHDATDGESARVTTEIYDSLVRFSAKQPPLTIEPALAEAWDISSDNTQITFKLRKNVKFHDGTDFNADAVVFNFQRLSDPANPFHKGAFEYWKENFGDYPGNLKSIEKVDDATVKFVLNKADGVILPKLSLFTFAIISPTAVKKDPENYFKQPVGTGPFIFKEWVKGDHITVTKNATYWDGPPKLDSMIWRVIPDNSARAAELQAGSIHTGDVAPVDLAALAKNPDITTVTQEAVSTGYLAFNQSNPAFKDVRVRQAFAYAINRKAIVDAFYGGLGVVPTQFQPPSILGYDPSLKYYDYNPDKARQLLKDAGQENLKTEFWYMSVIRGYFPDPKAIAQAMASDLSKVGVTVDLKTEDWGAYLKDRNEGKFPLWIIGWGSDNGDPDNFIGYHFGTLNKGFNYDNPKLREALAKGGETIDPKQREQFYFQAEKMVNDDVPVIPIAHAKSVAVARKNVKGWTNPLFTEGFRNVTVS